MQAEPIKIPIQLFDTNCYRNHKNSRAHIVLADDRIMHEALSTCDRIDDVKTTEMDYYIREIYRKDAVTGVCISSEGHEDIKAIYYRLNVSIMGTADDIVVRFTSRKSALAAYTTIYKWIFDEND